MASVCVVGFMRIIIKPQCDTFFQLLQNGSPSQPGSPLSADEDNGPPQAKRFKHLGKVLEQRIKEGLNRASKVPPGK